MIARFTLVRISGDQDGHAAVVPWNPAAYEQPGLATAHKLLGVAMTASEYQEPLAVMRRGTMRTVPDGAETWAVGEILWANASGAATHTRPAAPLPLIVLGTVFADEGGGNWTVDVDVRVLPSLGELSGVSVETPADLDVFIHKSSTHVWEPRRLAGTDITNAPAGGIAATTVQAAIDELDTEKASALWIWLME